MKTPNYIHQIEQLKSDGKYSDAHNYALDALKKNTDDYRLYEELSDIALFEWRVKDAYTYVQLAQQIHADSMTWKYLLWSVYVALGEFESAIKLLSEANVLVPNNPEILRHLGWAYACQGEYPKWIALLRRANILSPDDLGIKEDLWISLMSYGMLLKWSSSADSETAKDMLSQWETLLISTGAHQKLAEFRNLHS